MQSTLQPCASWSMSQNSNTTSSLQLTIGLNYIWSLIWISTHVAMFMQFFKSDNSGRASKGLICLPSCWPLSQKVCHNMSFFIILCHFISFYVIYVIYLFMSFMSFMSFMAFKSFMSFYGILWHFVSKIVLCLIKFIYSEKATKFCKIFT